MHPPAAQSLALLGCLTALGVGVSASRVHAQDAPPALPPPAPDADDTDAPPSDEGELQEITVTTAKSAKPTRWWAPR